MKELIELKEIIKNYISELSSLSETLTYTLKNEPENLESRLVINEDWGDLKNTPKIIICGDNPGIDEELVNKFFIAKAGKNLKSFIDIIKNKYNIKDNEILFFNKTPYHSKNSKAFNHTGNSVGIDELENSIYKTIQCLFEIWKVNNLIKFYFLGVDKATYINKMFFKIIKKDEFKNFYFQFYFLAHPSHNALNKSINSIVSKEFSGLDIVTNFDQIIKKLSDTNKERIRPTK